MSLKPDSSEEVPDSLKLYTTSINKDIKNKKLSYFTVGLRSLCNYRKVLNTTSIKELGSKKMGKKKSEGVKFVPLLCHKIFPTFKTRNNEAPCN